MSLNVSKFSESGQNPKIVSVTTSTTYLDIVTFSVIVIESTFFFTTSEQVSIATSHIE